MNPIIFILLLMLLVFFVTGILFLIIMGLVLIEEANNEIEGRNKNDSDNVY